ncbi:hypothetical protein ACHWQZ_G017459 [Mnemiopsis leidyi]
MKTILLFTAVVAGALCGHDYRQEFQQAYNKFAEFDGLLMSEPPQVAAQRYKSFVEYAQLVDKVNDDDSVPYVAEKNFLSILTAEERSGHLGFNVSGHESDRTVSVEKRSGSVKVAASRDFSNKISGIKNQGNCGSCWTFAATAALEGEMYFQNSKQGVSLSEQEYMDCATPRDGCNGGWMEDCYTYTRKSGRIAPTSAVPYKGKDSRSCRYTSKANAMDTAGVTLTGNINIQGDSSLLQYANAHIVSVAVYVNNNFMIYSKGVYVDNTCNTSPNHAVAVVGYGQENGRKYWRVRNSWGTGWGSNGYVLMDREKNNMCMISSYSHIPEIKCTNEDDCNPANPDDDSDDSDDGDDGDDGDDSNDGDDDGDQKLCLHKINLGSCSKTKAAAKKICEDKKISEEECVITKVKKCFYAPSGKDSGKNFVEVMMPCGDDSGDEGGDEEKCDAGAGLVLCSDCNCCKHEHMCYERVM